jgi:CPA2 family monovalent cation:H+ antiporter-2
MVDTAKALRPEIRIVLRTHNEAESELLRKDNLGTVFYGEEELANGMCQFIVSQFGLK